jgi:diadenosine tetraphosphate (Ap4A) HIT family hydrolase
MCKPREVSTVFSRIIAGELPGHFVWRDARCAGFMSINPMSDGHVLVVPIAEVDHWIDADADLICHLFEVSRVIGLAQRTVYRCERVGVIVAGYEVPHTHIHVIPTDEIGQLSFANAAHHVDPDHLAHHAVLIGDELVNMGHDEARR